MARPQRNNIDYFPFFCDDGNKMFYLEETYGNDGFAVFVKLLRELAKTDFHYLDLSKKPKIMFLSAKCKVDSNTLESIINDLVELEKFDAELWNENKIIWCQDFIDSIQDAYSKRSNNCIDRNSLIQLLISKGIRKQSKNTRKPLKDCSEGDVNPQSKVKYSKEDESIEDNKPLPSKVFSDKVNNLYDAVIPLFPDSTIPKTQKNIDDWKDELRKLIELDSFDVITIEIIIKLVREDSFWSSNFMSIKKLRKKNNEGVRYIDFFLEKFKATQKENKNALEDGYVYYQWMNDPSNYARRIKKEESKEMFEGMEKGGYTPVYLQSIKGKRCLW